MNLTVATVSELISSGAIKVICNLRRSGAIDVKTAEEALVGVACQLIKSTPCPEDAMEGHISACRTALQAPYIADTLREIIKAGATVLAEEAAA